ncbi:hypothetical protein [Nostoc sp.]|uniref:hypothetical protein n=1 Tax=Nostoc sp. TaxID=1180 RepID=UPI002FFAAAC2
MLHLILPNYVVLRSPLAGALHHRVASGRKGINTQVWLRLHEAEDCNQTDSFKKLYQGTSTNASNQADIQ